MYLVCSSRTLTTRQIEPKALQPMSKAIKSFEELCAISEQADGHIALNHGVRSSFTVFPREGGGVRVFRNISDAMYTARTEKELGRKDPNMVEAIKKGAAYYE